MLRGAGKNGMAIFVEVRRRIHHIKGFGRGFWGLGNFYLVCFLMLTFFRVLVEALCGKKGSLNSLVG